MIEYKNREICRYFKIPRSIYDRFIRAHDNPRAYDEAKGALVRILPLASPPRAQSTNQEPQSPRKQSVDSTVNTGMQQQAIGLTDGVSGFSTKNADIVPSTYGPNEVVLSCTITFS